MELPIEYRWLKAHGLKGLTPWHFIDSEYIEVLRREYKLETNKDIYPIARRQDNDDIAGFEVIDSEIKEKIITVHLTWKSKLENDGYPITRVSEDIFE